VPEEKFLKLWITVYQEVVRCYTLVQYLSSHIVCKVFRSFLLHI